MRRHAKRGKHGAMQQPLFIGAAIYRGSTYGRQHPLAIPRVSTVMDLCRAMGWLDSSNYRTSPRAKPAALAAFHTPDYIRAVQEAEASQSVSEAVRARHHLGTLSNPVFAEMFRRPATAAGGSIMGAGLIAHGGCVFHPAGGTHHGLPDQANGFCYFNDPVLAILALKAQGLSRITYLDIDAHHCDGVNIAFADDPSVRMISLHEENRWPRSGDLTDQGCGNCFNLPVPRGLNDSEFALIRDTLILPAIDLACPQALVVQCGADAVAEDPLSRLDLSNTAHFDVIRAVMAMVPRLLVLGGGGYNPWSVGRLWSGVWAVLNDYDIPDVLPELATGVLSALTWERRKNQPRPAHWTTTIRDTPNPGEIRDDIRSRLSVLTDRLRAEI